MTNYRYFFHNCTFTINDTVIEFPYSIYEIIEISGMLIILLDVLGKVEYNENVYGVSITEKKVKWQIKKRRFPTAFHQGCPYTGLVIYGGKLRLNNWCNTYLIVNPLNGEVLEEGFMR